uniref:Uncharacterized protein n=1 Tax=Anguilla anguilla TaxID=7936 RepID=A0A0E9REE4_ANGAN
MHVGESCGSVSDVNVKYIMSTGSPGILPLLYLFLCEDLHTFTVALRESHAVERHGSARPLPV